MQRAARPGTTRGEERRPRRKLILSSGHPSDAHALSLHRGRGHQSIARWKRTRRRAPIPRASNSPFRSMNLLFVGVVYVHFFRPMTGLPLLFAAASGLIVETDSPDALCPALESTRATV